MLSEERLAEIVRLTRQQGSVTNQELVARLGASESTIRRDIAALAAEKKLVKVHGGAVSVKNRYGSRDYAVSHRRNLNAAEKKQIGEYAVSLIEDGDLVYVDAGTTTEFLVDCLPAGKKAVFVTNAVAHAITLGKKGYDAYILAGRIKSVTEAVVDTGAILSLEIYNFTKGFFGANGIDRATGVTTPDAGEASVKTYALSRCKEKYILADSSKFGGVSSISFARFGDVTVITEKIPEDYQDCRNIIVAKEDSHDLHNHIQSRP